jgi:hypothetical protein
MSAELFNCDAIPVDLDQDGHWHSDAPWMPVVFKVGEFTQDVYPVEFPSEYHALSQAARIKRKANRRGFIPVWSSDPILL